jgi:hypothetical protein
MRITKLLLICMCCLMVVPTVWAQTANSQAKPGILGYLDPHTGAFRPIPAVAEEDSALAAATTIAGTVTVTLAITVKTAGLTNITCSEEVSVSDGITTASPSFFTESNSVAATTSPTGGKTCKLSIPYSWSLTTPGSDSMTTSYVVLGTTGTTGLPTRSSSRFPLDTRKVPASGAITALTAAVTL